MDVSLRLTLFAAFGGAVGSVARYLAVLAAADLFGVAFPWGTLFVNVTGSFAIGVLMAMINGWYGGSSDLRVLLVTGFLGGYTTFSAFSYELLQMVQREALIPALAYSLGSVVVSLLCAFLGFSLIRALA